jgi:hypothetical protein
VLWIANAIETPVVAEEGATRNKCSLVAEEFFYVRSVSTEITLARFIGACCTKYKAVYSSIVIEAVFVEALPVAAVPKNSITIITFFSKL